jgi:transcriptional regulator with XRE-family HTH domain
MTGQEMRRRREALHLTQEQLAKTFGVNPMTVSRWERGAMQINAPGMAHLALLSLEVLGDLERHAPELERLKNEATTNMKALEIRMRTLRTSVRPVGRPRKNAKDGKE